MIGNRRVAHRAQENGISRIAQRQGRLGQRFPCGIHRHAAYQPGLEGKRVPKTVADCTQRLFCFGRHLCADAIAR